MASHRKILISTTLFMINLGIRIVWGPHPIMLILAAYVGIPIMIQAIKNLRYRIIGIDLLVSIAVVGACLLGDYWEACAVVYLFYIGNEIERLALSKTRNTLRSLIETVPNNVRITHKGQETIVSLDDIKIGDTVVVKPGEMIPVDGRVISGSASVNQASITGESLPVEKAEGNDVYAGTRISDGYLIITVTQTSNNTVYAGIINYVESAQDNKTETQLMIDAFAQYYTPLVVLGSLLTLLFTRDFRTALSLLVVACPGALVIATPITIVSGIGAAGRQGVLIKSGQVFETLSVANRFAFDKTGTLTYGKLQVVDIIEVTETRDSILKLAAIGERYSEHPIASAIREAYGSTIPEAQSYELIQGKGVSFIYNDTQHFIGNQSLFEGMTLPPLDPSRIAIYIGNSDGIYGMIHLKDTVRSDLDASIGLLPNKVMVTGDREAVAQHIAKLSGITEYYANMLPEDKATFIKENKKNYVVAMVGDGVNDAPALAQADVGISVGGTSNSIAMETSDIILMNETIDKLGSTVTLSKAVTRIMKQNIAIAIGTALVLMMGVLTSFVSLSMGMLVHELTIFIVIGNALRLLYQKG